MRVSRETNTQIAALYSDAPTFVRTVRMVISFAVSTMAIGSVFLFNILSNCMLVCTLHKNRLLGTSDIRVTAIR